mgnify:CR=1 FL=1
MPTLWTAEVRRHLHDHDDGADRASVHERALEGHARAGAHGSPRVQVRHARDRDGPRCVDDDVGVTRHHVGGHGHASR